MCIKDLITRHLNESQPFGYEWKLVYLQLVAEMDEQGVSISPVTMERYMNTDSEKMKKLPVAFFNAVHSVIGLNLLFFLDLDT